jgi:two-component system, NarL family, nitrate/nitrite response regulator NarL
VNDATPVRILVVDDHTLFRRGLISLLQAQGHLEVVAEAADAGQAQRYATALQPDVILLDNHLPGVNGVDAIAGLREAAPAARILMLTVSEDPEDLARALQRGASGYLLKTVDSDGLCEAVERAVRGQSTVSPEMTHKLVSAFQSMQAAPAAPAAPEPTGLPNAGTNNAALATLSPREREILGQIAHGASNKAIARTLGIAETTVKIHVQHILRKLGLSSRVQAAVFVAERHR